MTKFIGVEKEENFTEMVGRYTLIQYFKVVLSQNIKSYEKKIKSSTHKKYKHVSGRVIQYAGARGHDDGDGGAAARGAGAPSRLRGPDANSLQLDFRTSDGRACRMDR